MTKPQQGFLALMILLFVCAVALAAQIPITPTPVHIERVRFDGDRVTCFVIPSEPLSLTCVQDIIE
jgi:hypothetical protein